MEDESLPAISSDLVIRCLQVQLLHVRGLGAKAALVLTALSAEKSILIALRALLLPPDLAALAHITQVAAR